MHPSDDTTCNPDWDQDQGLVKTLTMDALAQLLAEARTAEEQDKLAESLS